VSDGPLRLRICVAAYRAAWIVVCLLAANTLPAETAPVNEILVLTNGERVSGTSLNISDGVVNWKMPYGSVIDVPLPLVDRIEQVREIPEPEEPAVKADPTPPPVAEPPPKEKAPPSETPAAESDVTQAGIQIPAGETGPLPLSRAWYEAARSTYAFAADQTGHWTKRFELGGSLVTGNSETSEAYIGGIFERQFERVSHSLDWNGRQTTAGGQTTQSRWQFNGTSDFSKDAKGKWILFATHRHLFDQLADLNYRGTYAGGLGYRFINEGDKRLIARLGPGVTIEKFDPPLNSRITPDLFAEAEAKWPIFDRTLLEYKSTFSPSLNEIGVFRMTSTYGVLVQLDEKETWAMRAGLLHLHNSQPNPGKKEDDFTTTFSVVYTRK
jgi:putative salt-induced outer membrane protein YdiY